MPIQPIYLVDAFTAQPFTGNPAAVCPLESWPDDALLQAMTIEHNQSETAFFVKKDSAYELRWFTTSDGEIDLCGHATLASAHVIFEHLGHAGDEIIFNSRFSGELRVIRSADGLLTLDFPSWIPAPVPLAPAMTAALGVSPLEVHVKRDYLFVLANEAAVQNFVPDYAALATLGRRVCITAQGDTHDFVSRFFCPGDALPEDPVTGSAHAMLTPFWAARLGKTRMTARQLSARGGELICELKAERAHIGGRARTYMIGQISL